MMWIRTVTANKILEAVAQAAQRTETELREEVRSLRARNAQLMDTIVQMKREGFHPVAAVPASAPEPADLLPAPVMDALDELGLIGAQRAQHEAWAKRQLNKNRDAAVVASELLQGGLVGE